jgi:hypothetical protein
VNAAEYFSPVIGSLKVLVHTGILVRSVLNVRPVHDVIAINMSANRYRSQYRREYRRPGVAAPAYSISGNAGLL